MDLKPNVILAPHNYWFYLNLIHARLCQKNFPNVYKHMTKRMESLFKVNVA